MKHKSISACLAASMAVALFASRGFCANDNAGTSAAQFLKLGAGAAGAAMAEAQSAAADDVYAAYYNPAGLAQLERPMMGAMHAQYLQGSKYQYGAMALPLGEGSRSIMGLSIANLGVTDIPHIRPPLHRQAQPGRYRQAGQREDRRRLRLRLRGRHRRPLPAGRRPALPRGHRAGGAQYGLRA